MRIGYPVSQYVRNNKQPTMKRRKIPNNGRPIRTESSVFSFQSFNIQKLLKIIKKMLSKLRFKNSK
jgi:hypothetical protein